MAEADMQPYVGNLRKCGWADCPGVELSADIRLREYGYAHDVCHAAVQAAGDPERPAKFEAARTKWGDVVFERDRDGTLRQFAEANTIDGAKRLAKALNANG